MTVKEYLHQIYKYESAMKDTHEEIRKLKPMLGIRSMDYSQDRVQTSPNGQGFTRIADHIADLELDIVQYSKQRQKIVRMIEALPIMQSKVLYDIYVLHMKSLDDVAEDLMISYGRASHLHTEALQEFDNRYKVSKK